MAWEVAFSEQSGTVKHVATHADAIELFVQRADGIEVTAHMPAGMGVREGHDVTVVFATAPRGDGGSNTWPIGVRNRTTNNTTSNQAVINDVINKVSSAPIGLPVLLLLAVLAGAAVLGGVINPLLGYAGGAIFVAAALWAFLGARRYMSRQQSLNRAIEKAIAGQ